MKKVLQAGGFLLVGVVVLTLLTLRLTGLEPAYLDPRSDEFAANNRIARPGLWLAGEVVTTPVTNWDFVNKIDDPIRKNTIMVETRDRKSTRLNSSHIQKSRMPSSA